MSNSIFFDDEILFYVCPLMLCEMVVNFLYLLVSLVFIQLQAPGWIGVTTTLGFCRPYDCQYLIALISSGLAIYVVFKALLRKELEREI